MNAVACPPEERLARFLERVADEAEVAAISSHLVGCDVCRMTLVLLAQDPTVKATPAADPLFPDGPQVGRYALDSLLGNGGMGEVYLAHDGQLGRRVALKRVNRGGLSASAEQLLLDEARALARLNHPNVVAVFDVIQQPADLWLAMEYVEGPTLRRWLSAPRPPREVLAVFRQLCAGLAAAHACGVAHGDVKPDNALVGGDGRVRLVDFGLALVEGVGRGRGGTPAYMAPEQRVTLTPSPAADQYSLCLALAEALTGERPRVGEAVRWPRGVPATARAAVERGLSASPKDRFPSLDALEVALRPPVRERAALAAALVTLGVLVALTVGLKGRPRASPAEVAARAMPGVVLVVAEGADGATLSRAGLLVPRASTTYVVTSQDFLRGAKRVGVLRFEAGAPSYGSTEGGTQRLLFERARAVEGARLVRADPGHNLAVLDLAGGAAAPPVVFAGPEAGARVVVLGHSAGAPFGWLEGPVTTVGDDGLQLAVATDVGSLGGPVVDAAGRVVGVVTGDAQGVSHAATGLEAQALVDDVSQPFVTDRSTPEKTVRSCWRAFELGRADAWVDCIDTAQHWRLHREMLEWMLTHAESPNEAYALREVLEHTAPDYSTKAHAVEEARAYTHELFSHDPPTMKTNGPLLANWLGVAPSFPDDFIGQLRLGARVEDVVVVNEDTAWVSVTWAAEVGGARGDSFEVVRCGPQWCLRTLPPPEDEATRPPGFPPIGVRWNDFMAQAGPATLEGWRRVLESSRFWRWW